MRLKSEYAHPIFWRMFDPDDGIRVFGVAEGTLAPGGTVEHTHPSGQFQLEIRKGSLFAPFLVEANGVIYPNSADLVVTALGHLQGVQRDSISVTAKIQINIAGPFVDKDKPIVESRNSALLFSGARDSSVLAVTMDSFTITRAVTAAIVPEFGTFSKASGKFSLPVKVTVAKQSGDFLLVTDHVTSPNGLFSGTGIPLDASTRIVVLAGAGTIGAYEGLLTATLTLSRLPGTVAPSGHQPPVHQPPVHQPPVHQPPVHEPPVHQPSLPHKPHQVDP